MNRRFSAVFPVREEFPSRGSKLGSSQLHDRRQYVVKRLLHNFCNNQSYFRPEGFTRIGWIAKLLLPELARIMKTEVSASLSRCCFSQPGQASESTSTITGLKDRQWTGSGKIQGFWQYAD